jgi:hypothetical protein
MTTDHGQRFVGWLCRRRGGRWWRCCQAPDLGTCAKLLAAEGDKLGIPGHCRIMTTGMPPRLNRGRTGGEGNFEPHTPED